MKLITISNILGILLLVIVSKAQKLEKNGNWICKGLPIDIVFVLDSSRSIWGEDFMKQLDFVNYMVDHVDVGIGQKQVRVGVLTFSDFATVHIYLNNFLDKTNLKRKINGIPQITGNTSIGNGLHTMREEMFMPNKGARPNVRHIAILLTDGYSQDERATQIEARASQNAHIEIYVIGIGKYIKKSELKAIANQPHSKYLYYTPSYEALDHIRDDVIKQTCKSVITETCHDNPADIIFVLDSSTSIWRQDFQKQLDLVKYMIDHVDIGRGPKGVQIGVETFSDDATVFINLNDFYDKTVLKWKITQIPQDLGNTSIGNGLKKMRTVMFRPNKGARPNVRHIAIIITDGTSQDQRATQREAQASRNDNIELYVIGIGQHITKSELRGIASKPLTKYLFYTPSYEALDNIRKDVIKITCRDDPTIRPPKTEPDCRDGELIEIVFMISNIHFGQEKTRLILNAIIKVIQRFENYFNVYFGAVFEDCEQDQDVVAGSITSIYNLESKFAGFRFGSFVSLLKKLKNKGFSYGDLKNRRIGFMFLDSTLELNTADVLAEMKRLSFGVTELYAAFIGNVNEKFIENSLWPRHHFISIHSYNHLIEDLPSRFTKLICRL